MADLLECVIQIKALREALATAMDARSTSSLMSADMQGVPVWQQMADAERRYASVLGTGTGGGTGPASTGAGPDAFVALRRANLARLDRCTAAQLAGLVEWPGRPSTTVADVVAIMLANDTEALGELRRGEPRGFPGLSPSIRLGAP